MGLLEPIGVVKCSTCLRNWLLLKSSNQGVVRLLALTLEKGNVHRQDVALAKVCSNQCEPVLSV